MSTKPENLNRSGERVKSDTPQKIMALGIWEVGAADCLNKADADFYARQAISALKEAGFVICPIEPTEAMIRMMDNVDYVLNVESVNVGERYGLLYKSAIQASTHED